ncbi:MAG: four helix bundle protein, partial [Candidatus Omnitrophica bacterium]|nr:four helix bundle protein [Candidatus Omnitrophota bacterium]
LRRATLSIAANIVEGQASSSKRDFLNFLNIANRSLVETEYLLEVSMNLGYLVKEEYEKLERIRSDVGVLLHGLSRSIKALL